MHLVQVGATRLHFVGSLLQLRGSAPSPTPLCDPATGDVCLFNGEVFGGIDVAPGASDSSALLASLSASDSDGARDAVTRTLSCLRGPWAVAFWESATRTLWFGRDVLGRRSLLIHLPRAGDGRLLLTSSAPLDPAVRFEGFAEVVPGMYSLQFDGGGGGGKMTCWSWADPALCAIAAFERPAWSAGGAASYDGSWSADEAAVEAATDEVLVALRRAVAVRCQCIDERSPSNAAAGGRVNSQDAQGGAHISGAGPELPPARLLILFSGGVDSTLLAALADEVVPPGEPIDLASICFDGGASPDRLAALDALEELRAAAPGRPWRLIAVDRRFADVEATAPHLLRLLAPSDTVMDLNIGGALWLAAEADGVLAGGGAGGAAPRPYRSAARAVLLGHGADELFAGYARHRTRFRAGGWAGLSAELALDVRRLWRRNLGRDDRLVADRGREGRHPFLDERVVAAALALPLAALADLALPAGTGDKRVLRLALARLGLPRAAAREKRAIQFGSRLARAANLAQFGGTRRANARGRSVGAVRLAELVAVEVAQAPTRAS